MVNENCLDFSEFDLGILIIDRGEFDLDKLFDIVGTFIDTFLFVFEFLNDLK